MSDWIDKNPYLTATIALLALAAFKIFPLFAIAIFLIGLAIWLSCYLADSSKYNEPSTGYIDEHGDEEIKRLTRFDRPKKKIKIGYLIEYKDGNGNLTERVIQPIKAYPNDNGFIRAFCELADEERTFRLDRIQSCVELETGELINDVFVCFGHKRAKRYKFTGKIDDE